MLAPRNLNGAQHDRGLLSVSLAKFFFPDTAIYFKKEKVVLTFCSTSLPCSCALLTEFPSSRFILPLQVHLLPPPSLVLFLILLPILLLLSQAFSTKQRLYIGTMCSPINCTRCKKDAHIFCPVARRASDSLQSPWRCQNPLAFQDVGRGTCDTCERMNIVALKLNAWANESAAGDRPVADGGAGSGDETLRPDDKKKFPPLLKRTISAQECVALPLNTRTAMPPAEAGKTPPAYVRPRSEVGLPPLAPGEKRQRRRRGVRGAPVGAR